MAFNVRRLRARIDGKITTKAQLLRKTGMSRPALDSILDGNDFRVSTLMKLAEALEVNVGYFFDEENINIRNVGGDYAEEHSHIEKNVYGSVGEAILAERAKSMQALLDEKDERIAELKERIKELKNK